LISNCCKCKFSERDPDFLLVYSESGKNSNKTMINNMNLKDIKQKLFPIIKIISTALITSAIGLEL
jgi:hypothetical protein